MAEFCFKCFKEKIEHNANKENTVLSEELDLCEGCGDITNIVIEIKDNNGN